MMLRSSSAFPAAAGEISSIGWVPLASCAALSGRGSVVLDCAVAGVLAKPTANADADAKNLSFMLSLPAHVAVFPPSCDAFDTPITTGVNIHYQVCE